MCVEKIPKPMALPCTSGMMAVSAPWMLQCWISNFEIRYWRSKFAELGYPRRIWWEGHGENRFGTDAGLHKFDRVIVEGRIGGGRWRCGWRRRRHRPFVGRHIANRT